MGALDRSLPTATLASGFLRCRRPSVASTATPRAFSTYAPAATTPSSAGSPGGTPSPAWPARPRPATATPTPWSLRPDHHRQPAHGGRDCDDLQPGRGRIGLRLAQGKPGPTVGGPGIATVGSGTLGTDGTGNAGPDGFATGLTPGPTLGRAKPEARGSGGARNDASTDVAAGRVPNALLAMPPVRRPPARTTASASTSVSRRSGARRNSCNVGRRSARFR
jgi:hypothetical protein